MVLTMKILNFGIPTLVYGTWLNGGRLLEKMNAEYLNSGERCIVCFQPQKYEEMHGISGLTPLIKHHVAYFPEKIAFVHYECHKKIHGDPPMTLWIQYDDGDARKFYALQKAKDQDL